MKIKSILVVLASAAFVGGCGDGLLVDSDSMSANLLDIPTPQNIVVAAVGLESQPGLLSFHVPAATQAEIVSAKLYWVGRSTSPTGDSQIRVGASFRTGTLLASYNVGGDLPWVFFYEHDAIGLIRHNNNNLFVSRFDLGPESRTDGVAAVVIFNDPDSPWTAIHTVLPLEFVSGGSGSVVDLPIGGSAAARNAQFLMLAGACTAAKDDNVWWSSGPGASPSDLVGAGSGVHSNLLGAVNGNWMDALVRDVSIPPNASHFTYQVESPTGSGDDILHLFGAICIDGEATTCTGSISGSVWHDEDRNGTFDGAETGFADVPVSLRDDTDLTVAMTTTDASGAFSFALRCAGDYRVEVDETALPGGLESTTCGAPPCNPAAVNLPTDGSTASVSFGWAEPVSAGTRCFLGMRFWRRQFSRWSGWHSGQTLDEATIKQIVEDVDAATGMDWTHGDGELSASDIGRVLSRLRPVRCGWVERYYLVSLLNWALNGSDPAMPVDTNRDGEMDMSFVEYMAVVEALLATDDYRDCFHAGWMVFSVLTMPDEGCEILFGEGAVLEGLATEQDRGDGAALERLATEQDREY